MEELQELFPDTVINLQQYRSFVNQPERVQISSQEDVSDYDQNTLTTYFNFKVNLPRPALNVKSIQLARASIPNVVASFPDTECTWWYYALPTVSPGQIFFDNGGNPGDLAYIFDASGNVFTPVGVLVNDAVVHFDSGNFLVGTDNYLFNLTTVKPGNVNVPCIQDGDTDFFIRYTAPQRATLRPNYLRYIRLMPSNAQPELMEISSFLGGFNRIFSDFDDLVTELNKSCIDDPLNGELENEVVGTFKFVPNQVSFSYNQRFSKIVFTGNNTLFSYVPAASDDPNLLEAAPALAERDRLNTRFTFTGAIQVIQPWIPYRYLNLRLGFNYATYPQGDNFLNTLRPIPSFIQSLPPLNDDWNIYDHVAPGYADLVNTSCCHIYCDFTGGSTVDSIANKALLATVPLNTGALGVGFHSLPLNNPLTKISDQIYSVYIELRTDAGQPFYLGNNAIVSLELILTY